MAQSYFALNLSTGELLEATTRTDLKAQMKVSNYRYGNCSGIWRTFKFWEDIQDFHITHRDKFLLVARATRYNCKSNMETEIENRIMELDEKYGNAVEVFGSAIFARKYVDNGNLRVFFTYLNNAVQNAIIYGWHETPANAARTYCNLCRIDPALVEVYIDLRFENAFQKGRMK